MIVEVDDAARCSRRRALGSLARKRLALADAQDQRAAQPGADDQAGEARADDGQAVGALELRQRPCGPPRPGRRRRYEAIRWAMTSVSVSLRKTKPSAWSCLLEGGVVLDDAVVDDGDLAVAAEVRVGVGVGGAAVRGPARVADALDAGRRLLLEQLGQFGDAAGTLAEVQLRAGQGGQAGAVVAAVFQAAAVEQDGPASRRPV